MDALSVQETYFWREVDQVRALADVVAPHYFAGRLRWTGLSKLRALDPAARVIMASADIQSLTRELALQGGARDFIIKPFVAEQVLPAVAAALTPAAGGTP